jgi:predicted PurR-regulated permease PerM
MAQSSANSRPRLLTTFAGIALGVLVVTVLYFAQELFIPVALAVFLSFLMAPIVDWLERWVGRIVAVVGMVVMAAALVVGVGWGVTHQMGDLLQTLNRQDYAANIGQKVESVEGWLQGGGLVTEFKRLTRRVERQVREGKEGGGDQPANKIGAENTLKKESGAEQTPQSKPADSPPQAASQPQATVVAPITPPWLADLPGPLRRAGEILAQVALVTVLLIFMLVRREDLRNRVIRLVGHGRLTVTTMALDDATSRISRYLFAQLVVNSCYGLVFAAGLYFIGVPYAFLWGFLAAVMRYVPYVGIWLAVLPPVLLSLAVTPGWSMPWWVFGLVAALELLTANFVEPILFGQSIGVSEVALLVSAAFWAWLWGPIGLVLSAPLTVCLVVAGRYVPQLEFFDVLLGDAPVLPPRIVFYQRLLARDQDEAAALVEKYARAHPPELAYDEFLIPALVAAKRDRDHGNLGDADERAIVTAVAEIADELKDLEHVEPASGPDVRDNGDSAPAEKHRATCLLVPARDETDEMALRMLRGLLDPKKWKVDLLPSKALAAELIARVREERPGAVCVAALPPGGLAHTRYLCKRLRRACPKLRIAVGVWGIQGDVVEVRQSLAAVGADQAGITLLETRDSLEGWGPVLAQAPADTAAVMCP